MTFFIAKSQNLGHWKKGEIAIIVYEYENKHFLLFESGFYDGFSEEDLKRFLSKHQLKGVTTTPYEFKNVIILSNDYSAGKFKYIFKGIKELLLKEKINVLIENE